MNLRNKEMSYSFLLYEDFFHYICIYHLNLTITPKKLFFFVLIYIWENETSGSEMTSLLSFISQSCQILFWVGRDNHCLKRTYSPEWVGGQIKRKLQYSEWNCM